jgi:peptidoglycan hydrolase-like protein with peptidoglycan-binding domain
VARRVVIVAAVVALIAAAPAVASASPRIAAIQVALRAHGLYPGPIDGIAGPLTKSGVVRFQQRRGLVSDGRVGPRTRRALGRLGRPLLGRRELWIGRRGWDVSSLEFRLRRYGLATAAVDGVFDRRTAAALRRYQQAKGLVVDGIAGAQTFRTLLGRPTIPQRAHVVQPGESFFSIAQRYRVSPWRLAHGNGYRLDRVIHPGARLLLPVGASSVPMPENREAVRASLDRWSAVYGVDPKLARALAWMESGFQNHVVSSVGARGVMQLLPETWDFIETVVLGEQVPDTADGNVRVGVRYLRWQLDHFGGDVRLALAGWYQGARAVREIGLYDDTKQFVSIVLSLYGTV